MKNSTHTCFLKQKNFHFIIRVITCIFIFFTTFTSYAAGVNIFAVFIGNSITRHGPAPTIGWTGNWGMAASAAEKDYVQQVAQQLAIKSIRSFNIYPLEAAPKGTRLQNSMLAMARQSQLLVIQLGDNVKQSNASYFSSVYSKLLVDAKPAQGLLICLSTWYQNAAIDAIIKQKCEHVGGIYVQIGDIHHNPYFTAINQDLKHAGVSSHPGNAGMAEIAKRISTTFKEHYSGLNHHLRQP